MRTVLMMRKRRIRGDQGTDYYDVTDDDIYIQWKGNIVIKKKS